MVMGVAATTWAKDDDEVAEERAEPVPGHGTPRTTLADRIPSVTHRAFSNAGRVELVPLLGLSLSDPFYRYVMPGAAIHYAINEAFSVGASLEYYAGFATSINVAGGTAIAQPAFNRPNYAARLEVAWSPLYGKISWLAESIMHFDTYLSAGAGIVGPKTGNASLAGTVALGQHYFFNNWMALRVEVREQFYNLVRDSAVNPASALQSLLSASVGLCFYFPQETEQED